MPAVHTLDAADFSVAGTACLDRIRERLAGEGMDLEELITRIRAIPGSE